MWHTCLDTQSFLMINMDLGEGWSLKIMCPWTCHLRRIFLYLLLNIYIQQLKVNASVRPGTLYFGMGIHPCSVTGDGFSLEKTPQMSKTLSYILPFFSLIGKRCQDKMSVWYFLCSWQCYVNMLLWGQHLWLRDRQGSRCGRFGSHNRQGPWKWVESMDSSLRKKERQLPLGSREQLSWNNETPVTCRGLLKG